MNPLQRSSLTALKVCMGVKPGEKVLVITDAGCREIGTALYEAALDLNTEAALIEIPVATSHGAEPPGPVAQAMQAADVVLVPTTKSMTHTQARRAACAAGARVATLPGITVDCMVRCMDADYELIARRTERLTQLLTEGRVAHLTTPAGTDLTLPIEGIRAIASTGLLRNPGDGGNLPSGEAYLMPVEGQSEGVMVVDGSMAGIGKIQSQPLRITIREGRAVSIEGGPESELLKTLLEPHGADAFNVAELGVGTNYRAGISGAILEDEKAAGTVHVALGNNVSMGGSVNVPVHLDGVMLRPTLYIDDILVLEDGEYRIDLGE